jgi:hypothetical protein
MKAMIVADSIKALASARPIDAKNAKKNRQESLPFPLPFPSGAPLNDNFAFHFVFSLSRAFLTPGVRVRRTIPREDSRPIRV